MNPYVLIWIHENKAGPNVCKKYTSNQHQFMHQNEIQMPFSGYERFSEPRKKLCKYLLCKLALFRKTFRTHPQWCRKVFRNHTNLHSKYLQSCFLCSENLQAHGGVSRPTRRGSPGPHPGRWWVSQHALRQAPHTTESED